MLSGRGYVDDVTEQGQAVHSGTGDVGHGAPLGQGGLEGLRRLQGETVARFMETW